MKEPDRFGHNDRYSGSPTVQPLFSRIIFMASAKGYVMARRPGMTPFVTTEKLWKSFDLWTGQPDQRATAADGRRAIEQREVVT